MDQETYRSSWKAGGRKIHAMQRNTFLQNRHQIKDKIILGVVFSTVLRKCKISAADELGHLPISSMQKTKTELPRQYPLTS